MQLPHQKRRKNYNRFKPLFPVIPHFNGLIFIANAMDFRELRRTLMTTHIPIVQSNRFDCDHNNFIIKSIDLEIENFTDPSVWDPTPVMLLNYLNEIAPQYKKTLIKMAQERGSYSELTQTELLTELNPDEIIQFIRKNTEKSVSDVSFSPSLYCGDLIAMNHQNALKFSVGIYQALKDQKNVVPTFSISKEIFTTKKKDGLDYLVKIIQDLTSHEIYLKIYNINLRDIQTELFSNLIEFLKLLYRDSSISMIYINGLGEMGFFLPSKFVPFFRKRNAGLVYRKKDPNGHGIALRLCPSIGTYIQTKICKENKFGCKETLCKQKLFDQILSKARRSLMSIDSENVFQKEFLKTNFLMKIQILKKTEW